MEQKIYKPQQGVQMKMLKSSADITIGGGAAGCFDGNTLVNTIDGHVKIKDIKEGDLVLSINRFGELEYKKVLALCFYPQHRCERIRFSNGLITTVNHEFLFKGKWATIGELRKRAMEESRGQLFHIKSREVSNFKSSQFKTFKFNETSKRQKWLHENNDIDKWEVSSYINSQTCSRSFFTRGSHKRNGKPQEFKSIGQSFREFGVGNEKRKLSPCSSKWTPRIQMDEGREATSKLYKKRFRKRHIYFKRTESNGNKKEVQARNIYSKNAGRRIWCGSCYNKGRYTKAKLEAREITLDEILNSEIIEHNLPVYDLCVEDNHNYVVTKDNIVVHNSSKTFSMLMRRTRHMHVAGFTSLILRRTTPQIRNPGGLWDTAEQLYPLLGAKSNKSMLTHTWASGAESKFNHMQHDKNMLDYQGTQICAIGFDELTHFSKKMFFYMISRNRSMCGVRPYVDAGCNPDPDSFVAELIAWWIGDDGFPIKERSGVKRYFTQVAGMYIFGDTAREVYDKAKDHIDVAVKNSKGIVQPKDLIKSLTFISGSIYDNKELLKVNPEYLGNLLALPEEEQRILLDGNWKVRLDGNELFKYKKFEQMFNNHHIKQVGQSYITADIAMKGADCFVVYVWKDGFIEGSDQGIYDSHGEIIENSCEPTGKVLVDIEVMEKSDGADVITLFNQLREKWHVPCENIVYDADGVGQFIDGFIQGANPFNNTSRPFNEENYRWLKDQVFFKCANAVNFGLYYVLPEVANREFDIKSRKKGSQTLEKILFSEMRTAKRDKVDVDGKLRIEGKDKQKEVLGHSPDFIDSFTMVEYFDARPYGGVEEFEHDVGFY